MKTLNQLISRNNLEDALEFIETHKVVTIPELALYLEKSEEYTLLDVGALECLGCVMIKMGTPVKVIALLKEDQERRFARRFRE